MYSPERSEPKFFDLETEDPKHKCGVFGVFDPGGDVARTTFYGLYRLQHRGQESAGIATLSENGIKFIKRMGLLRENFTEEDIDSLAGGFAAIGHTRYSNTGGSTLINSQPSIYGPTAIGQNGNLTNAFELRLWLNEEGAYPSTNSEGQSCSSDGEIISQTIAIAPGSKPIEKVMNACQKFEGAYTLTILMEDSLIVVRDPKGFWPLCLGKINGNGWVVASESTAFELIGAEYVREVNPGEVLSINSKGIESFRLPSKGEIAECPFDWTYFRRPDSLLPDGRYAYQFRMELGRQLARDFPVNADIIIGEKDSGTFIAHGYAEESGIPFNEGSIKDPYSKRIFIDPDPKVRERSVNLKHSFLKPEIEGKVVAVGTDSIVRATNSPALIKELRRLGAKRVIYIVGFPPISDPCFFGIDMAQRWELAAFDRTVEQIREYIGADELYYQTLRSFELALRRSLKTFCQGCFTGIYPIPVPSERDKYALEVTH
ncbi:MAG TPA: amidophosphoribosyltransferase [Patescibacteria group bacterium]